jgi:hypothetical protein
VAVVLCLEAAAQTGGGRTAFLDTAPRQAVGLPFLRPNTHPYSYADYSFDATRIRVYHLEAALTPRDAWERVSCTSLSVRGFLREGFDYLYYASEAYGLFFRLDPDSVDDCAFIEEFVRRFTFFRSADRAGGGVPFPGVINLDG